MLNLPKKNYLTNDHMTSRIFIQTISLCQKMWKRLFVKTTNAQYCNSKITFLEEKMYRVGFGKGSKITI